MGIFEDEEKKMATEDAASVRWLEQRKAERDRIVQKVAEDLNSYIANRQSGPGIDISVNENVVSLRKKTTSNTLEINYTESEIFVLTENGKYRSAGDQGKMARCVMDWIKQ